MEDEETGRSAVRVKRATTTTNANGWTITSVHDILQHVLDDVQSYFHDASYMIICSSWCPQEPQLQARATPSWPSNTYLRRLRILGRSDYRDTSTRCRIRFNAMVRLFCLSVRRIAYLLPSVVTNRLLDICCVCTARQGPHQRRYRW